MIGLVPKYEITFTDQDLERVRSPYNDALILTLRTNDFDVKMVLTDEGSSCEVIYLNLLKKLNLSEVDLMPVMTHLMGFNSASLSTREDDCGCLVRFDSPKDRLLVMNVSSPYSAIIRRT